MDLNLNKKIVVISGGAGLIGKSFVREVARFGGIPVIAEIDEARASKVRDELVVELKNEDIYYHACDICNRESIEKMIEWLTGKFDRIDVLVNNAYPRNPKYGRHFFDVEYKDFSENISMNLGGYFLMSQVFAKLFVQQNAGNIINIASIYGVVAPRFEIYEGTQMSNSVEYAAIKSGVIHLTKYMAKYLKGHNIKINSLSLGGILDNQPERFLENYGKFCLSKGMLNPADVTGALIFLISDLSEFVNGQNLIVDDGFSL